MKKKLSHLSGDNLKVVIIVLVALNLLLAAYVAFFKRDAMWIETLKAGWSENFALVKKLYSSENFKSQQAETLAQVLGSMDSTDIASENTGTQEVSTILDQATMDSILKDTFVKWDENARFVIFEYSDLLCPFCQRHHNDQTLQKVQEKYPNDVALVLKNMPLVQLHPTAFLGAEWAECAGKLWWSKAFYDYADIAFTKSSFDNESVVDIAKEIWINANKFSACVEKWESKAKIDAIINEARTIFNINWTPGNVILDKQTGKYVIVNWAYPFEKFDSEVQNLMNQ